MRRLLLAGFSALALASAAAFADEFVFLSHDEGVHYPSDFDASRSAATAIVAVLMQHPAFLTEFEGSRAALLAVFPLGEGRVVLLAPHRVGTVRQSCA